MKGEAIAPAGHGKVGTLRARGGCNRNGAASIHRQHCASRVLRPNWLGKRERRDAEACSIDFDPALFDETSLSVTSTGTGDWSELILGSFLAVPAQYDAYYLGADALAIGDSASGFAVRFDWLGAGTPDGQTFTIWDTGSADVLFTDVTTAVDRPPVGAPEPASGALAVIALAAAGLARRRGRRLPG